MHSLRQECCKTERPNAHARTPSLDVDKAPEDVSNLPRYSEGGALAVVPSALIRRAGAIKRPTALVITCRASHDGPLCSDACSCYCKISITKTTKLVQYTQASQHHKCVCVLSKATNDTLPARVNAPTPMPLALEPLNSRSAHPTCTARPGLMTVSS